MNKKWHDAAERGDAAALQAMLKAGAAVNSCDRYGQTALMLAARHGHLEAVRVLLAAGADLDHTAKYRLSALMIATINGHKAVVQQLVQAGADTSTRGSGAPGFSGRTALDLANNLGRESIGQLLRRVGA
jgi:ankyrin repeat protein